MDCTYLVDMNPSLCVKMILRISFNHLHQELIWVVQQKDTMTQVFSQVINIKCFLPGWTDTNTFCHCSSSVESYLCNQMFILRFLFHTLSSLWHELHQDHLSPSRKYNMGSVSFCFIGVFFHVKFKFMWSCVWQIQFELELGYWKLWWAYLDVLNAELQHLVGSSTDEVDIYTRQCCEHKLLRNLIDQRNTQTFLQVYQHLWMNTKNKKSQDLFLREGHAL